MLNLASFEEKEAMPVEGNVNQVFFFLVGLAFSRENHDSTLIPAGNTFQIRSSHLLSPTNKSGQIICLFKDMINTASTLVRALQSIDP